MHSLGALGKARAAVLMTYPYLPRAQAWSSSFHLVFCYFPASLHLRGPKPAVCSLDLPCSNGREKEGSAQARPSSCGSAGCHGCLGGGSAEPLRQAHVTPAFLAFKSLVLVFMKFYELRLLPVALYKGPLTGTEMSVRNRTGSETVIAHCWGASVPAALLLSVLENGETIREKGLGGRKGHSRSGGTKTARMGSLGPLWPNEGGFSYLHPLPRPARML